MAIVRDLGNGFNLTDWTAEVSTIVNTWGTIGQLGLFQEVPIAEHTVAFETRNENGGVIVDRVRGDRNNVGKEGVRKIHTFAVPHFPLSDAILPQDIQGKRLYGSPDASETLANKRAEKMEYIRKAHARTLEVARAQAIVAGTAYAPNGTVTQNWYTEFGITRTVQSYALATSTTDLIAKVEGTIAAIQDNAGLTDMTGMVTLCSPGWFSQFIAHNSIRTAYTYFASTQDPLRSRLAAGGSNQAMHRTFDFGGMQFIEMRDSFNGTPLIPANEAYAVPLGTDMFKTYFSPANRFFSVNTLAEQVYMFESPDMNGSSISIETESNHISALLRPELCIKLTA